MIQNHLWLIYALGAAILWGLQYATIEQILKNIPVSLLTLAYSVANAFTYIGVVFWLQPEIDLHKLNDYLNAKNLLYFGLIVLVGCASTLLSFTAIAKSNATNASIIEITYPLFVALFAALIYQERSLNGLTLLGGFFILLGVIIVVVSSGN